MRTQAGIFILGSVWKLRYGVLGIKGAKSHPVFTNMENLLNSVKLFRICAGVTTISTWPCEICLHGGNSLVFG